MTAGGVPQQLSGMIDRFSMLRTGVITAVDPFGVLVDVGGTVLRAAYVRQSEPQIDDVVAVTRQGATWLVHGTSSASGDNLVPNPSFEETTDGILPTGWVLFNVSGLSTMRSVSDPTAIPDGSGGDRILDVFAPGAAATSLVYSGPISVVVGDVIELSTYANGNYPGSPPATSDLSLRALWFANATDLYPTTSAADSTAANFTNIAEADSMRVMRGTVTVPAGAVFMRVALRTAADADSGASYDFVTARVTG